MHPLPNQIELRLICFKNILRESKPNVEIYYGLVNLNKCVFENLVLSELTYSNFLIISAISPSKRHLISGMTKLPRTWQLNVVRPPFPID